MRNAAAIAMALFGLMTAAAPAFAAVTPCEDVLKSTRDARAATRLDDATAKTVDGLIQKGIDRCNADDDKRADGFFGDAMKLMGK